MRALLVLLIVAVVIQPAEGPGLTFKLACMDWREPPCGRAECNAGYKLCELYEYVEVPNVHGRPERD